MPQIFFRKSALNSEVICPGRDAFGARKRKDFIPGCKLLSFSLIVLLKARLYISVVFKVNPKKESLLSRGNRDHNLHR